MFLEIHFEILGPVSSPLVTNPWYLEVRPRPLGSMGEAWGGKVLLWTGSGIGELPPASVHCTPSTSGLCRDRS